MITYYIVNEMQARSRAQLTLLRDANSTCKALRNDILRGDRLSPSTLIIEAAPPIIIMHVFNKFELFSKGSGCASTYDARG